MAFSRNIMNAEMGYDPGGISTYDNPSLPYPSYGSGYDYGTPSYDPKALGNKPFTIAAPRPSGYSSGAGYGGPNPYPGQEGTQPYYGMPTTTGGGMTMVSGVPTYGGTATTGGGAGAPNVPLPAFNLPPYDEGRISELTQKAAAPGMRALRTSVQQVQGKYYENPNVKRMTLRDALAGYGAGLESVMTGAGREARGEYAAEYAPQLTKAQMEYQAQVQATMNQYQNAWRDYMSRMGSSRF